jgi:hypothetical protein
VYLFKWHLSSQSPSWASIPSSSIGHVEQTKIQRASYSTEISPNTDLSTKDKFMWNKHKLERNMPSMYIY